MFFYPKSGISAVATAKYTKRDRVSTMVVMKGLAITAGSRPMRLAPKGRRQPASFASKTVMARVTQTTKATATDAPSKRIAFPKPKIPNVTPHRTATRSSFHRTESTSRSSTSPRERARMTATEAWLPALPAVPISIGINEVRIYETAENIPTYAFYKASDVANNKGIKIWLSIADSVWIVYYSYSGLYLAALNTAFQILTAMISLIQILIHERKDKYT